MVEDGEEQVLEVEDVALFYGSPAGGEDGGKMDSGGIVSYFPPFL